MWARSLVHNVKSFALGLGWPAAQGLGVPGLPGRPAK